MNHFASAAFWSAYEKLSHDLGLRLPNFKRIMLHPTRLRVNLTEFLLGHAKHLTLLIDEKCARAGRALIESQEITVTGRHRTASACRFSLL